MPCTAAPPTGAARRCSAVDASNYWHINFRATGTELNWALQKTVAGTSTIVATSSFVPAAGDIIRAAHSGTSISCYVNDVMVSTVTDSAHYTATRAGLTGDAANDTQTRWDDFQASVG